MLLRLALHADVEPLKKSMKGYDKMNLANRRTNERMNEQTHR